MRGRDCNSKSMVTLLSLLSVPKKVKIHEPPACPNSWEHFKEAGAWRLKRWLKNLQDLLGKWKQPPNIPRKIVSHSFWVVFQFLKCFFQTALIIYANQCYTLFLFMNQLPYNKLLCMVQNSVFRMLLGDQCHYISTVPPRTFLLGF